jgi:predicted ester cyclase
MGTDSIDVVRRLVDAINRHDWRGVEGLLHPAFRRHSLAAGKPGTENAAGFLRFLEQEHETFPDATEQLLEVFADGAKVAALHRFTGTQHGRLGSYPPSGKRVQSVYIALYHVEDGGIRESWAEWDNLSELRQLGHLPKDSPVGEYLS